MSRSIWAPVGERRRISTNVAARGFADSVTFRAGESSASWIG